MRETRLIMIVQEINKVDLLVEPTAKMNYKSELADGPVTQHYNKRQHELNNKIAALMSTGTFSSRGSRVLAAALSDKNKQSEPNKTSTLQEQRQQKLDCVAASIRETAELIRQDSELKNRIRSPKNKVLFSEPVVTNQYEYEQTVLPHLETDSAWSRTVSATQFIQKIRLLRRKNCSRSSLPLHSIPTASNSNAYSLAIEEPSSNPSQGQNEVKNARKRPFIATLDCDHESGQQESSSNNSSGREDGCLFSSPKIAKITPYFHDEVPATLSNSLSQKQKLARGNFKRSQRKPIQRKSSRSSCYRLAPEYHDLPEGLSLNPQPDPVQNSNNCSDEAEFNEVFSNALETQPQQNYFSWITNGWNYLSSQVNKFML